MKANDSPRILFVRLSALGDVIHAMPALAALRAAYPKAHIGWLVEDRAADLVRGCPMIDRAHVLPRAATRESILGALAGPLRALAREVRAERYEAAVDFQGLAKSAVWTRVSGAPRRIGFRGANARELSWLCYNEAVTPAPERAHVIEQNLALLAPLGVDAREIVYPSFLDEVSRARGKRRWGDLGSRYARIVMNPGAGWETKQWPAENYGRLAREIADEIGARVALAWGPGEEPLVGRALAAAEAPAPANFAAAEIGSAPGVYALPRTTFAELGGFIAHAHLCVAGDTGPAHLAAALGVPTLGLYGASDARRNGPRGARCEAIQLAEPACIPCWKKKCEWREPLACLKGITQRQAKDACYRLLKP